MSNNGKIITAIVVIIIVLGGAFALLHKSSKTNTSSTTGNSPAVNNSVLATKTDSSLGQYLADPSGKPLYTYNADTQGVSNCSGACLANWPPYTVKGSLGNLPSGVSTIKRSDNGETQYTYNGLPLYYFISDSVGKVTGSNVDNFKLAKPAASSSSRSPSSQPSSTPSSSSSSGYNY